MKTAERTETEQGKEKEDTKHLSFLIIWMAPGTQGHQEIP